MEAKIQVSVEPREGLKHTFVVDEEVRIRLGDKLVIQLGRDGEVESVILVTGSQTGKAVIP